jgi:hypothetical protein
LDDDAEAVVKEREEERKDSGKSREETSAVAPTRKALDLSHTSRGVTKGRRESIEPKQKRQIIFQRGIGRRYHDRRVFRVCEKFVRITFTIGQVASSSFSFLGSF